MEDRHFINPVRPLFLGSSYFTEEDVILGSPLEKRISNYNIWKQKKLKEVRNIERLADDRNSYLACG